MCRYAMYGPYKSHYACFACRKAFKQPPIGDYFAAAGQNRNSYAELAELWSVGSRDDFERRQQQLGMRLAELEAEYGAAIRKCPDCSQPMIDMGLDFKSPRRSDTRAWRTLQGMYRTGHAFHTCGCNGPGWIPKSSADYKRYLDSHRSDYVKQLSHVEIQEQLTPDRKREAAEYWANRIEAIDMELRALR
jgi:hypothetical protein